MKLKRVELNNCGNCRRLSIKDFEKSGHFEDTIEQKTKHTIYHCLEFNKKLIEIIYSPDGSMSSPLFTINEIIYEDGKHETKNS